MPGNDQGIVMKKFTTRQYLAAVLVAGTLGLSLTACGTTTTVPGPTVTKTVTAPPADVAGQLANPSAAAAAQAAGIAAEATASATTGASDVQVCNDVNAWESNNEGEALSYFGGDAASLAIVTEASGASAVDSDISTLSNTETGSSILTQLTEDCAIAGVTLTGTDFSAGENAENPIVAPSTPAASAAAPSTPAAPAETVSQQQAIASAQDYLTDGEGFSYAGLLQQLTSADGDGFSTADATFALNNLKPDWDAQAVISAKGYLADGEGFSKSSLTQQLTSADGDGFTEAQAEYGVSKAGL
jgi:hypothetical protein